MKNFKVYLSIIIMMLLLTFSVSACQNKENHIVVGKWKGDNLGLLDSFIGHEVSILFVHKNTAPYVFL